MESQDETNEMKKKLKIMTHQIDQFKEEIGNKESALVKVRSHICVAIEPLSQSLMKMRIMKFLGELGTCSN